MADSWEQVWQYFQTPPGNKAIVKLIEYIKGTDLRHRLYPAIFLDNLVVCAYNPMRLFSQSLHIRADLDQYYAGWYWENQLAREEKFPVNELTTGFNHLMKKITWY